MRSVRFLMFGLLLVAGCDDNPMTSRTPDEPAPPAQGVQAFVQVSNDQGKPGDEIHVWVKAQIGGQTNERLGSYTGRLRYDPATLRFVSETAIDDGMRVTNPAGAPQGDLRFAGAAPTGFTNLTLYDAVFEVIKSDYLQDLRLDMEEVSAAVSLTNLTPTLQVAPRVFLHVSN